MKTKCLIFSALLIYFFSISSCKKDFLDAIPDKSLLVPRSLTDMQALLDNNNIMNSIPTAPLLRTDELYSTNANMAQLNFNIYTFSPEVWISDISIDWNKPFQQIFYANIILDGLKESSFPADAQYNAIKGSAYFFRAMAYYNLLQQFCKPYLPATAEAEKGMPIRLDSDVNKNPPRSTLAESYRQVIADLQQAIAILPESVQLKTRPSKTSAVAMMAKTYLVMNDFVNAERFANLALEGRGTLLDFNTLNAALPKPFPQPLVSDNAEIVFWLRTNSYTFFIDLATMVPDSIYNSYQVDDLRRSVYFSVTAPGKINFKGSPSGTLDNFSGICNDELYLIRAECAARNGKLNAALSDLNFLLSKRYKAGRFTPYGMMEQKPLLSLVLRERFKELLFRGTRWADLRRLNSFDNLGYRIQRTLAGQTYTLLPGGDGYVFPVPRTESTISGIE